MRNSFMSFVALALVVNLMISSPPGAKGVDVAYYSLTMQWQVAYCNLGRRCATPPLEEFKIHGLWPVDANDVLITCPDIHEPMPASKTMARFGIKKQLDRCWPALKRNDNYGFWKNEWKNHGKCSGMKPLEYFSFALFLAQEHLSLKSNLEDPSRQSHPVTPGSALYTQNLVRQALAVIYQNIVPEVQCNRRHGGKQLYQIRFCYTSGDPPVLRDCPTDFKNCGPATGAFSYNDLTTVHPANNNGLYAHARNETGDIYVPARNTRNRAGLYTPAYHDKKKTHDLYTPDKNKTRI